MFESNTNQACDTEAQTLGASFLITTTTTSLKYGRVWRRSLYVRIFISRKKGKKSSLLERTSSVHVIDVHSDNGGDIDVDDEELLPETVAEIVKRRDLNFLRSLGGVDRVHARLRSNLKVINLLYI